MEMKCPGCGKTGDMKYIRTVTPENTDALYSMDIFAYTCPECGRRTEVDHDAAYHDEENKIMVIYGGSALVDEITNDYLVRIVYSQNGLVEKVHILEQGRDDRIVEIMKIILSAGLMNSQGLTDFNILYDVYEGKEQFAVVKSSGEVILLRWDEELYKGLCEEYLDTMPPMRNRDEFVIDRNWAIKKIGM